MLAVESLTLPERVQISLPFELSMSTKRRGAVSPVFTLMRAFGSRSVRSGRPEILYVATSSPEYSPTNAAELAGTPGATDADAGGGADADADVAGASVIFATEAIPASGAVVASLRGSRRSV